MQSDVFFIRKRSGQKEEFSTKKLQRSLQKVGADQKTISQIIEKIKKEKPLNTNAIHEFIIESLGKKSPAIAIRYNIKQALIELGPAGYPFEQYVAHIFASQGFKTLTNQIINGKCVTHEVDVIAIKNNEHFMIECKFHNRLGLKTTVKAALATQARFEDIHSAWEQSPQHNHEFHRAWMVTNTKFTSEAIKYANCMHIELLGWKYPKDKSIEKLIDSLGLHPITALTSLSRKQKRSFIKEGFVLCRDVSKHTNLLKNFGFSDRQIQKLIQEINKICYL